MPPSELDSYIATKFAASGVHFYHAENLRNFSTYCRHRALLSRSLLMQHDRHQYTRFYSDPSDQDLDVLGRVFGNIYDFGSIFSRAPNTIPNVYGPITLVFKPTVFATMSDIAITPRSIVHHRGRWRAVQVRDEATVDEIASGDDFGRPVAPNWQMCELSCENESLSFDELEKVIVEPIVVCDRPLIEYVRATVSPLNLTVIERGYRAPDNARRLRDLVATCEALPDNIVDDAWSFDEGQLPGSWAALSEQKRRRVPGWCKYFYFGTLHECRWRELLEEADQDDDRTICDLCDPGEDHPFASLVDYHPLGDGGGGRGPLDVGRCQWCSGISVRCNDCGAVRGVSEHEYGEDIECDGGCGTRFRVVRTYDDGYVETVELVEDEEDWDDDDEEEDADGEEDDHGG